MIVPKTFNDIFTFTRAGAAATYVSSLGYIVGVDFSATSNTIGTGAKTFTLNATTNINRDWVAGIGVHVVDQTGGGTMTGTVTSYTASTQALVLNITSVTGSGTSTNWRIGMTGRRKDYDPVTLAARGILIEGARTNLLTYSEQFNDVSWFKTNATLTANAATGPDGTMSADLLVPNVGTSGAIQKNFIVTSGSCTVSIFVKPVGITQVTLAFDNGTHSNAIFTLTGNGSYTGGASGAGIQPVGNGWYRVYNVSTGINPGGSLYIHNTQTGEANGTNGFYVFGAQSEAASFPSSYIPTTTAAVTHNADSCLIDGARFTPWFNASEGTILVEAESASGSGVQYHVSLHDGTVNEYISLGRDGSNNPLLTVVDGGVSQVSADAGTLANNTSFKLAARYKLNDFAVSINGGAAVTDASGTLPTVDRLDIGALVSANHAFSRIKRVVYYPTALSAATTQAIAA